MGPDGAGDADKVALGQQILLETLLRTGQTVCKGHVFNVT